MNTNPGQPAVIHLVGEDAEVQNCPFVHHEIEADIRNALQVGRDIEKRVRAGQKRVRNWFLVTPVGCTELQCRCARMIMVSDQTTGLKDGSLT